LAVGETVQGLTLLLHPLHRPFLQTEDKKTQSLEVHKTLEFRMRIRTGPDSDRAGGSS
jgi:hypothetical protein